jgi:16S rRNA (guanine1207-N2)-methyltransferase
VTLASSFGVFGAPHPDLADIPAGAQQFSPLVPGAGALENVSPASLTGFIVAAPPGTLERRYVLALAMRALQAGAPLTVMAPKEKGGNRIAKELAAFGCAVETSSRRHQRICVTARPAQLGEVVDEALKAGGPQRVEALGLWSQPGIFSWDRIDPGSALLLSVLPAFSGRGADLGCGIGLLARAVLASPAVTRLELIDIDRRAITAARHNIEDARIAFHWADARKLQTTGLDFIVMNPPFHEDGVEDKALGQAFVQRAQQMLRDGGVLWLVANRHLPYEALLAGSFSSVTLRADGNGFKVYEATK